jgi:hypothetical protein
LIDIYDAIKQGGIGKAFALIEQHFPALIRTYNTINRMEVYDQTNLPKSHYTLYKLRCQQFIEALRASGEAEAIQFGKYYLRPYHKFYPELTNSVTPLIAYENLENENVKDLLSQERRDSIADEVNEMILGKLDKFRYIRYAYNVLFRISTIFTYNSIGKNMETKNCS